MLSKKLAFLLGIGLIFHSFVASASTINCPTAEDVKEASFQIVPYTSSDDDHNIAGQYVASAKITDNAAHVWSVWVWVINASDENEARNKLKTALSSSTLVHPQALDPNEMPEAIRLEGHSVCYLTTNKYDQDPTVFIQSGESSVAPLYIAPSYPIQLVTPPEE
jgi:hypothetical protein